MKARYLVIFAMLSLGAAAASAEINVGCGAAFETGGAPLSQIVPQVFVENLYRVNSWESFGLDFVIASLPAENTAYANGLAAGPVILFGTDISYRFPPVGPVEFAYLVGGLGFQDYHVSVNGIAAQTGLAATAHFGSIFVQGRGLYRFFSSTGSKGTPVPLGTYSFAILGGYSFF